MHKLILGSIFLCACGSRANSSNTNGAQPACGETASTWQQGSIIFTGGQTDLALQGPGFFVLQRGAQHYFTRWGQFVMAADGTLVDTSGKYQLLAFTHNGELQPLQVGTFNAQATATARVDVYGNVDANATIVAPFAAAAPLTTSNLGASVVIYDTTGQNFDVEIQFHKDAPSAWHWYALMGAAQSLVYSGHLQYDSSGRLTTSDQLPEDGLALFPNLNPQIVFDFGDGTAAGGTGFYGITQFVGDSYVGFVFADGSAGGTFIDASFGLDGLVSSKLDAHERIGQIAIARFTNSNALTVFDEHDAEIVLSATNASGAAVIGFVGNTANVSLISGALEEAQIDDTACDN